jgi:hypothetical protein
MQTVDYKDYQYWLSTTLQTLRQNLSEKNVLSVYLATDYILTEFSSWYASKLGVDKQIDILYDIVKTKIQTFKQMIVVTYNIPLF